MPISADVAYPEGSYGFVSFIDNNNIFFCYGKFKNNNEGIEIITNYDSLGAINWAKSFGGMRLTQSLNPFIKTKDGNIIASGQANSLLSPNIGIDGGCIFKFNLNGDSIWSRYYYVYPEQFQSFLLDVDTTAEGGYIFVGSLWGNTQELWVLKVDSTGCIETDTCGVLQVVSNDKPYSAEQLLVYPNPSSGVFTINIPEIIPLKSQISKSNRIKNVFSPYLPNAENPLISRNPSLPVNSNFEIAGKKSEPPIIPEPTDNLEI